MAGTARIIQWWLGHEDREKATEQGHWIWFFGEPGWSDNLENLFWKSLRECYLEEEFRLAFQVTKPLWFALWMDSPLKGSRCSILAALLCDFLPIVEESIEECLSTTEELNDYYRLVTTLERCAESGEPFYVNIGANGHADLGWDTTFPRCPRCKAQVIDKYPPNERVPCQVCGFFFIPAETGSRTRMPRPSL